MTSLSGFFSLPLFAFSKLVIMRNWRLRLFSLLCLFGSAFTCKLHSLPRTYKSRIKATTPFFLQFLAIISDWVKCTHTGDPLITLGTDSKALIKAVWTLTVKYGIMDWITRYLNLAPVTSKDNFKSHMYTNHWLFLLYFLNVGVTNLSKAFASWGSTDRVQLYNIIMYENRKHIHTLYT